MDKPIELVRIGEPTSDDIKVLEKRKHTLLTKEEYDDAIHIFYTNIEVLEHNVYKLGLLKTDKAESKATWDPPKGSGYVPFQNDWGLVDNTNFSMNLELKIGARIMLVLKYLALHK